MTPPQYPQGVPPPPAIRHLNEPVLSSTERRSCHFAHSDEEQTNARDALIKWSQGITKMGDLDIRQRARANAVLAVYLEVAIENERLIAGNFFSSQSLEYQEQKDKFIQDCREKRESRESRNEAGNRSRSRVPRGPANEYNESASSRTGSSVRHDPASIGGTDIGVPQRPKFHGSMRRASPTVRLSTPPKADDTVSISSYAPAPASAAMNVPPSPEHEATDVSEDANESAMHVDRPSPVAEEGAAEAPQQESSPIKPPKLEPKPEAKDEPKAESMVENEPDLPDFSEEEAERLAAAEAAQSAANDDDTHYNLNEEQTLAPPMPDDQ